MLQTSSKKRKDRSVTMSVKPLAADASSLGSNPAPLTAPFVVPKKKSEHPDRILLEHCTDYAMHIAGALGAYDVDTSEGNDFAHEVDSICRSRATPSLDCATKTHAKTADGIRAKAEVVRLIIRNTSGGMSLEDEEIAFLVSHLDDVKRFHRAMAYGTSSYKFEQEA